MVLVYPFGRAYQNVPFGTLSSSYINTEDFIVHFQNDRILSTDSCHSGLLLRAAAKDHNSPPLKMDAKVIIYSLLKAGI